jgi:carbamoylphosphate synthase large subunit
MANIRWVLVNIRVVLINTNIPDIITPQFTDEVHIEPR